MINNMTIYNVTESCTDCPKCVRIEFESADLIRVDDYVKANFFGKRLFKVVKAENSSQGDAVWATAEEIGHRNNLLINKREVNIFKMKNLMVEIPTREEIEQAEMNSRYI